MQILFLLFILKTSSIKKESLLRETKKQLVFDESLCTLNLESITKNKKPSVWLFTSCRFNWNLSVQNLLKNLWYLFHRIYFESILPKLSDF